MDAPDTTYRVDRALPKGDAPLLAALLADLALGIRALPRPKGGVPIRWNLAGVADRPGPAWPWAVVSPLAGLACWARVLLFPLVDPLRRNDSRFPGTLKLVRWLLPLTSVAVHVAATRAGLGLPLDRGATVRAIVAVSFVVLGDSMGRIRHDWCAGIRTA